MDASFKPVADFGLLVVFADTYCDEAHDAVLSLDRELSRNLPEGVTELVPAMVNLMIVFDPIQTDHATVQAAVELRLTDLYVTSVIGKTCRVDVCYEGEFAPDLDAIVRATGLSRDTVINIHLGGEYPVLMFGFAPGYGYLGGVPDTIQVPRKLAAVPDLPVGSVMIAGSQCLVTTLVMPTGWSVIGRSPTPIMTGQEDAPTLFGVGDVVHFNRISREEYDTLSKASGS